VEAVVAQYSSYVASIGYRILGSRAELDDLLQDVFLEVHRNLRTLREPEAVRGWLATITVRVARRMVRMRRLTAFLLPFDAFRSAEEVDIGASAEERHLYSRMYAVLDRVPANSRIAWVLKVLEGEPLGRVAALCGCSLAAVKRRIAKVDDAMTEELAHA
jgi:RNA polymerase sigma-70 factor (ECF subfamily)